MKIPLAEFRSRDRNREFADCYRENLDLWPVPYREERIKTSFGETHVIISGKRENPPVPLFRMIPVFLFREAVAVILAGKKPGIRRLIGKQYAAQNFPDKTSERLLLSVITGFLPELPLFPRELSREEWTRLPDQTLIITGEEEIYFDPGDAREIAAKYRPDIPFLLLEETGHSVSMEMPEQVNDTLLTFLSGTVPN